MKYFQIFVFVLIVSCFLTYCTKEIIDIDTSDIDVKLVTSSYAVSNGSQATLSLIVTNLGSDDAKDLEIRFKQAHSALKFIEDDKDTYSNGVWVLNGLVAQTQDTLNVIVEARLPNLLPTLQVSQSAYVLKNINYDPNAANNVRTINVAIIE